jgi:hypothetical protein
MHALTVTLLPTKLAVLVSTLQYNGKAAIILALLLAGINDTVEDNLTSINPTGNACIAIIPNLLDRY